MNYYDNSYTYLLFVCSVLRAGDADDARRPSTPLSQFHDDSIEYFVLSSMYLTLYVRRVALLLMTFCNPRISYMIGLSVLGNRFAVVAEAF